MLDPSPRPSRRLHRLACWLTALGILLSALAPFAAVPLSAGNGDLALEICSAHQNAAGDEGSGSSPLGDGPHGAGPLCPICFTLGLAHALAPPPSCAIALPARTIAAVAPLPAQLLPAGADLPTAKARGPPAVL